MDWQREFQDLITTSNLILQSGREMSGVQAPPSDVTGETIIIQQLFSP